MHLDSDQPGREQAAELSQSAGAHPREADRIAVLENYTRLGAGPEPEFDAITRFATEFCQVPSALISLVGRDRQIAKSVTGPAQWNMPRSISLCAHAILDQGLVEVPDTALDARFRANPLCRGPQAIRFYSAAPLMAAGDLPIGVLCVLDTQPRTLTEVQRNGLTMLSGQVMAQLELRRTMEEQRILALEADHRIKNSLQTLAAMVRFQGRSAQADETRNATSVMLQRIRAMGLLHELLQSESASTSVDLEQYILRVVDSLSEQAPDAVAVEARLCPLRITPSKATSIGIIISEWVANAYKHAFPGGRSGAVEVSLVDTGGGTAQLQVADNGVGAPKGTHKEGLGSQIIQAAIRSLDATTTADMDGSGLRQRLIFAP
ncbi:MAG: histidine kinase dimerization/phosphoacceptor domain -containing protein [Pseudomonadota bacterium]